MCMLYWLAPRKKSCDDARFLRLGRKGNGVSTWYVCALLLPQSLLTPSPSLTMPLSPEYSELTCRKPDNSDATILEKSESHWVVSDFLQPHGLYSPWNSSGQNTGVGSCSLFQGIFPTQGLNPGLPHCRGILYQLSHPGSPPYWKDHWQIHKVGERGLWSLSCNSPQLFLFHTTYQKCKYSVPFWVTPVDTKQSRGELTPLSPAQTANS